jgi:hypothetical protein
MTLFVSRAQRGNISVVRMTLFVLPTPQRGKISVARMTLFVLPTPRGAKFYEMDTDSIQYPVSIIQHPVSRNPLN